MCSGLAVLHRQETVGGCTPSVGWYASWCWSCSPLSLGSVFLRDLSLLLSLEKVLFSRGSAMAQPSPLLLLLHFFSPPREEKTTLDRVERGVSAPSSRSNPTFHFTLGHDCNSSLPLRVAEQEMNSTHSFPKFPSPPPLPPYPSPPLPLPPTGREGCRGLMGNVVLRLPNVLNSG